MLTAIEHALLVSFSTGWEILWALIMGVFLSAVIQAVVSKNDTPYFRAANRTKVNDEKEICHYPTGINEKSSLRSPRLVRTPQYGRPNEFLE